MDGPAIDSVAPFFIVRDVASSVSFYCARLGFTTTFREPDCDPFFAIVCRGGAMLFLKAVGLEALPNCKRSPEARWDAFFSVLDPDGLAAELGGVGVEFSAPLVDTHDGLRGFELEDPDGYVLFFGRPQT